MLSNRERKETQGKKSPFFFTFLNQDKVELLQASENGGSHLFK